MLNKYDIHEKNYLKLIKELRQVRKDIRNLPYVDIIPFQRGWTTSVILREDILNRKDAEVLLQIVKIGYNEFTHIHKLEHIKLIKKGIYSHTIVRGDTTYITNFIPRRIHLSEKEYLSLSEQQRYFSGHSSRYSSRYGLNKDYYKINIPLYWVKLEIKPNMITKMQDINPDLISKEEEIHSILEKPPYRKYYYRDGYSKRFQERVEKRNGKQKVVKEIKTGIEEYKEID